MTKLTFDAIRKAQPGSVLRDGTVAGLHLRVTSTGKIYYFWYRTKAGVERRPKIGNFPAVSLESARTIAAEWAIKVSLGQDPSQDRKRAIASPRVSELWSRYSAQKISRKKSLAQDERMWAAYIAPKWGNKLVEDITFDMVYDLHASMRDTPYQANRVLALLSAMFNFAWRPLKWTPDNPCKGVHRFPENRRRRYMSAREAANVAAILDAEAVDNPMSVAFLWLLIFTGARKSEIANARWDWLEGNVLRLPDSKTGARPIYLPPQVMAVLDKLPRTNGTITGIQSPSKLWRRIRTEAECPDLRIHDLRHSFASAGLAAGLTLNQIGELLGHKSTQTTHRYAHLIEDVAHASAAAAADVMETMMKRRETA